jgi:TRAP-type mannitol/chloroaromatic compound transport system permease small subunit
LIELMEHRGSATLPPGRPPLQVIESFNLWLGRQVAWVYLFAMLGTFYEVLARYLFNAPTTWAFEVTIFLCATGYLLSGPSVTARDQHIAITSIVELVGPRLRWWMRLLALVVGLFSIAGMAYAAWFSGIHALRIWERTGTAYNAPTPALIKPMIAIAGILVVLQLLVQLVRHLRSDEPPPLPNPTIPPTT